MILEGLCVLRTGRFKIQISRRISRNETYRDEQFYMDTLKPQFIKDSSVTKVTDCCLEA
jgi:hypothetical protein